MKKIRLQKVIAQGGIASRRAAEALILQGRVTVNGAVVDRLGSAVDPDVDEVRVDRRIVRLERPKVYYMLHKPAGCVTTLKDPQGRETVMDLARKLPERVFPVGRLDYDAQGLLLLTNDGPLAHRLQHPRYAIPKTYLVKVKGHPDESTLQRLRSGVPLREGRTAPAKARVTERLADAAWLKITLHQGWNRQIKRMGEAVGHRVLKIKRILYGPLVLADLPPGKLRPLTPGEVHRLYLLVMPEAERAIHHEKKAE